MAVQSCGKSVISTDAMPVATRGSHCGEAVWSWWLPQRGTAVSVANAALTQSPAEGNPPRSLLGGKPSWQLLSASLIHRNALAH
ncbi:hypothetical protein [Dendronalium sp. ChiSLP03b]|uniref:hypothetical protein n=1 Tax=Dendronalium sp. ChiSLP03b TaxID=3075381 RepID=UPI002AD2F6DC|nr:hypothetical protein [Dendronalium sp. ChiSLP03b]MDZ8208122.1 hypothetical protein [Dendronalium sp. ChiSLP03b]